MKSTNYEAPHCVISLASYHFLPLTYNIILSTLFWNTPSLSSLRLRDQVSHQYKTTGKNHKCMF
jgi:hypothetical protein